MPARVSLVALLCLLLGAPLPAAAGGARATAVDRAEAERLSAALRHRVSEVDWAAADAAYRRLAALPGRLGSFEDHWRGVQTARSLGDVTAAWERLQAASRIEPTHPDVLAVEARILAWYGPVDVRVGRRVSPRPALTLDPMPADPVHRRVLEAASEAIETTGRYEGLLPLGMYTLGSDHFEIVGAREPVRVRVR